MKGSTHVTLSILFFVPLAYSLAYSETISVLAAALMLAGVVAGSTIPDADAKAISYGQGKPLGFSYPGLDEGVKPLASVVKAITRHAFYLPAAFILRLLGDRRAAGHRGMMHSLVGVMAATLLWAAVFYAASFAGLDFALSSFFIQGMLAGAVFHLYADSLTPTGVNWFYPRNGLLRGKLANSQDFVAVVLFAVLAAALLYIGFETSPAPAFLAAVAFFGLLLIAAAFGVESSDGWDNRLGA